MVCRRCVWSVPLSRQDLTLPRRRAEPAPRYLYRNIDATSSAARYSLARRLPARYGRAEWPTAGWQWRGAAGLGATGLASGMGWLTLRLAGGRSEAGTSRAMQCLCEAASPIERGRTVSPYGSRHRSTGRASGTPRPCHPADRFTIAGL